MVNVSLELDGVDQYLGRIEDLGTQGVYNFGAYNDVIYNFPFNLDIADVWTLAFWSKPRAYKEHTTLFATGARGGQNEIRISATPVSEERGIRGKSPSELRVLIRDQDGEVIKHYSWPDWFQEEEWRHTAIQWNGTDLEAFKAGIPTTTGVTFVNAAGTMSDGIRKVFYGSAVAGEFASFSGTVGHFGVWNTLLAPGELETIVSGAFSADLTVASGSYISQNTLQHYWKPGDDPTNLGKDFVTSGTLFNLTKEHNLDANNIVIDEPI